MPNDDDAGPLDHAFEEMVVGHEAVWQFAEDAQPADAYAAALEAIDRSPYRVFYSPGGEDEEDEIRSIWDIIPDSVAFQNAKYRFEDGENQLSSGKERREVYSEVAMMALRENGQPFTDQYDRLWYFYEPERKVYRVDGNGREKVTDEFRALLREMAGLTPDQDGRIVYSNIRDQILRHCPQRNAYRFTHYDRDDDVLYITDFDGGYYRLDGEDIEYRQNGEDVFFLDVANAEGYEYIEDEARISADSRVPGELPDADDRDDLIWRIFANRMNPAPNQHMLPDQQRKQLYLHLHLLPLIDYFTGRPIMAFVGKKGSGKTVIMRSLGKFIYGDDWKEQMMDDDKREFINTLTNNTLAFIDNYDDGRGWANDVLASTATGSAVSFRELYTTNEQKKFVPRCFIGMTSRDPPFRRDDIADRLLVFRLERLTDTFDMDEASDDFLGMTAFLSVITDNRDSLWSEYLDNLNAIVETLRNEDTTKYRSSHRMADWATLAKISGPALGIDGVQDLLDAMEEERSYFALEDDPLYETLRRWLADKGGTVRGKRYTAGDLLETLRDYAEDEGVQFTYSSPTSLGKRLSNVSGELDTIFGFNIEKNRGQNEYVFPETRTSQSGLGHHTSGMSQGERKKAVYDFIKENESEFDGGVPEEAIVASLDIPDEKIRHEIDEWKTSGNIYEPQDGHLRTT